MISVGDFFKGKDDPWDTFGTEELCTWHNQAGSSFVQSRVPRFAKKLSQRSDTRLVSKSYSGGYLRIFTVEMQPWQVRRIVIRYLQDTPVVRTTNEGFEGLNAPLEARKAPKGVKTAGSRTGNSKGIFDRQTHFGVKRVLDPISSSTGLNANSRLNETLVTV